jgi:pseudoazurin
MEIRMGRLTALGAALVVAIGAIATSASAANFEVLMLNKGTDGKTMGFSPSFLHVEPGDTVTFIPVDKGHNVDGIIPMMPTGAEPFKGKMSQPFTQTFTLPGVYAVKCDPHYAMGMVAIVVVGDDVSNLDALKAAKNPTKAQERFEAIFEELED